MTVLAPDDGFVILTDDGFAIAVSYCPRPPRAPYTYVGDHEATPSSSSSGSSETSPRSRRSPLAHCAASANRGRRVADHARVIRSTTPRARTQHLGRVLLVPRRVTATTRTACGSACGCSRCDRADTSTRSARSSGSPSVKARRPHLRGVPGDAHRGYRRAPRHRRLALRRAPRQVKYAGVGSSSEPGARWARFHVGRRARRRGR